MLKKINRIKSKKDFGEIKNRGVMYHSPLFSFVYIKSELNDLTHTQFGFIISKKISKKAVDRNRIKRLLSSSLQDNLEKFKNNLKGVFLVKRVILEKDQTEINQEIEKLADRIQ